jgi:hypothetical protein
MDPLMYEEYVKSQREQTEYNKCILCFRAFNTIEEQKNMKAMLLSTDCYHMIHKHCLAETAI